METTQSQCKSLGIYIHIPFCRECCHYCDFLTVGLASGEVDPSFIALLCQEIELWGTFSRWQEVESIYFGGGTPSLCSSKQMGSLLETISHFFQINHDAEITIEANPRDLNFKKCRQ